MDLGNYSARLSPRPASTIHITDLPGTGLSEHSDVLPSPRSQLQTPVPGATGEEGAWLPVRQRLRGAPGLLLGLRGRLRGAKYVPSRPVLATFHAALGSFFSRDSNRERTNSCLSAAAVLASLRFGEWVGVSRPGGLAA